VDRWSSGNLHDGYCFRGVFDGKGGAEPAASAVEPHRDSALTNTQDPGQATVVKILPNREKQEFLVSLREARERAQGTLVNRVEVALVAAQLIRELLDQSARSLLAAAPVRQDPSRDT
jgi:hypothetical protein